MSRYASLVAVVLCSATSFAFSADKPFRAGASIQTINRGTSGNLHHRQYLRCMDAKLQQIKLWRCVTKEGLTETQRASYPPLFIKTNNDV